MRPPLESPNNTPLHPPALQKAVSLQIRHLRRPRLNETPLFRQKK